MNVANIYRKLKQILNASNIALLNKGLEEVNTLNKISTEIDKLGSINRLPYLLNNEMSIITKEDLEGISYIRDYAFYNNKGLTHIAIPDSVTSVGARVAQYSNYYYNDSNWTDGMLYSGKHLIAISDKLEECAIKDDTLTIAAYVRPYGSNITRVTIPDSVISIGEYAFDGCAELISVTIGNGVQIINDGTFGSCSSLRNVIMGESITTIGRMAFFDCSSLSSINIPSGVVIIDDYAFNSCDNLNTIYMNSHTPPTLGEAAINSTSSWFKIYVPMGSGDAYKSATNWSKLAYCIFERQTGEADEL